jgi:adenylate kinase
MVFLGKQGSGKGTQCARISLARGLPHISTGEILRQAVKDESPLGREVKEVMEAGHLVPDDLIMGLIAERLEQPDAARGALLDGCTRTRGQAEALEGLLGEDGVSIAINLDVPTELVVKRLSSRRVCQECGTIYTDADPSAISGTCENCGGDVIQRPDDTPEAIRVRLAAYERDTAPLLTFYEERKLLVTINGDQDVDAVTLAIDDALAQRGLT